MFDELVNVSSVDSMEQITIRLLDDNVLRRMQEEMASRKISFSQDDYWPEDVLTRKTSSPASVRKTLKEVAGEPASVKALHILQIISATSPGATTGVQRFLARVTFG